MNLGLLALKTVPRCGLQICELKCLLNSAYWRFMFAHWQTNRYFNIFSNINQQKNDQKSNFFGYLEHRPRLFSSGQ
jgi:hypothetical protein